MDGAGTTLNYYYGEKVSTTNVPNADTNETSKHLTRCTDPGWLMQLRQSIEGVMDILSEANVDQDLSDIIEAYLLAQDRQTMKDCIPSHSHIKTLPQRLTT